MKRLPGDVRQRQKKVCGLDETRLRVAQPFGGVEMRLGKIAQFWDQKSLVKLGHFLHSVNFAINNQDVTFPRAKIIFDEVNLIKC